jgi:hypothetical protein
MTTPQTRTAATAEMATGSVVSKDSTRIGHLRVGRGPAVVLLHGSNESARSHTQLALALADTFTVYLPRPARPRHVRPPPPRPQHPHRGRGPTGRPYRIRRAEGLRGQRQWTDRPADRTHPAGLRQVAAYEPALLLDRSTRYTGWVRSFEQEMA